jgi:hypothetical protein
VVSTLSAPAPIEQLSFPDADHGWALAADELFATSDGFSWRAVREPPAGALSWAELVTPSFGVGEVCGAEGGTRVVATGDGGLSRQTLPVPEVNRLACGSYVAPGPFFSPHMSASDGTLLPSLGTDTLPSQERFQPVAALADPGPGDLVDLWEQGAGPCAPGFAVISTRDRGFQLAHHAP